MPLLVASVVAVVPSVPLVMPVVSPLSEVVADAEEVPVVSSGLFPQATMPMHMEIASIKANIRIVFFIFFLRNISAHSRLFHDIILSLLFYDVNITISRFFE